MVVLSERQTAEYAESAKRRQILEGARVVFLTQGFDAASMGDIARAAKVSKGTLYVYFDSKEDLFQTIVQEECEAQAEQVFALDSSDHDVEAVLTRLGRDFIRFLGEPHRISSLRTVIAIAERMPELGRRFYAMGPTSGIGRVASYLEDQVKAGVLEVPDCELAAAQFLDSCKSTIFQALLFNARERASDERVAYVVARAVKTFLAAYKR
jgi:AcrR family transcriptional regulator